MVAGILFSAILLVLAVFAADGPRIVAYPVLIVVFLGIRRRARSVRMRVSNADAKIPAGKRPTAQRPEASLADAPQGSTEAEGASQLLDDLASRGFELWVEGEDLVVEGESVIDGSLADAIRANKLGLIDLLRGR